MHHNTQGPSRRARLARIARRATPLALLTAVLVAAPATTAYADPGDNKGKGGGVNINTTGLNGWLVDNALPLVVLAIGLVVVAGAKKKDWASSLTVVGIAALGLGVVGVSFGAVAVGKFLSGLIGVG